jgi:hypothetical protein
MTVWREFIKKFALYHQRTNFLIDFDRSGDQKFGKWRICSNPESDKNTIRIISIQAAPDYPGVCGSVRTVCG